MLKRSNRHSFLKQLVINQHLLKNHSELQTPSIDKNQKQKQKLTLNMIYVNLSLKAQTMSASHTHWDHS